MGDVSGLALLVGGPLWVAVLIYAIRTSKDWGGIMARWNERRRDRAEIEGDQYERLAKRCTTLEERCDDLEREVQECHRALAKERAGRLAAEALLMGRGNAHQEAQRIVSTERQIDAARREEGGK